MGEIVVIILAIFWLFTVAVGVGFFDKNDD